MQNREREQIVSVARAAVGTPWHHQGRVAGLGLDCIGLLVHVARELDLEGAGYAKTNYAHFPDQARVQRELAEYLDRITFSMH